MIIRSPLQRRILALGLLAALLGLIIQLAVAPAWQTYQQNRARIAQHREHIARFRSIAANLDALERRVSELEKRQALTRYTLPQKSATLAAAALQERIKKSIEQHGGDLISTRVLPVAQEDAFSRITVNVRMRARTGILQQVLYQLENATPYLVLDDLLVLARGARRGRADDEGELDVRFDVSGFLRRSAA